MWRAFLRFFDIYPTPKGDKICKNCRYFEEVDNYECSPDYNCMKYAKKVLKDTVSGSSAWINVFRCYDKNPDGQCIDYFHKMDNPAKLNQTTEAVKNGKEHNKFTPDPV